jgi:hypothetical protein
MCFEGLESGVLVADELDLDTFFELSRTIKKISAP